MTPEEIVTNLRTALRQTKDVVRSCNVVEAEFAEEYDYQLRVRTESGYARAMDLYPYVIEKRRERKRFEDEAELFEAAANFIESTLALKSAATS